MSSAAFLNELKNMKFSSTNNTNDILATGFSKKTDNNFDYGTTY